MSKPRLPRPTAFEPYARELVRHLVREGSSPTYRVKMESRFWQLARAGFPVQQFWAGSVEEAERVALDWVRSQEDGAPGRPPRSVDAVDNDKRLINLLARTRGLDRWRQLRLVGGKKVLRISLRPDDLERALDTYTHHDPMIRTRDLAIFVLDHFVAGRRGEVVRLDLEHLDQARGRVYVQASKNRVEAWAPVEPDLWPYVEAWLQTRPEPVDGGRAVFVRLHGPPRRLGGQGVYNALRRIGDQVGLRVNSNVLRHTRNKRLKLWGHDAGTRRYILRHTDEGALKHYDEEEYDDIEHAWALRQGPGLRGDPRRHAGRACPACNRPFTDGPSTAEHADTPV